MKTPTHKEITKDPLYKKLENILTRNFWKNQKFNKKAFLIYCEAVTYEAELFNPKFIKSKKYKQLLNMSDCALQGYLLKSRKAREEI